MLKYISTNILAVKKVKMKFILKMAKFSINNK